ncbi:hypothetical protein K469DRAFT_727539 [Zopfia rhizophila CBS 207.26]|uniref:Uncharacterized protein n=1 Tax=Zopfia rhizophila CBS 207.26 TaxID=1314779 RepID=A0A6A6ESJ4_9PEZI|nr:hypothetical protein K469DRAFT_727539 [Zopfia rhizophila CBS 207.26]
MTMPEREPTKPAGDLDVADTQSEGGDSAYAVVIYRESETASVTSSILAGHYENGRRHHALLSLDIKYASLQLVMDNKVFFAPVKNPLQIWILGLGLFEIDDAEQPWTWDDNIFDFIHMRTMTGCIRNWDTLFRQCFDHTKPGGYIELQEMDYMSGEATAKAGLSLRTSPSSLTDHLSRVGDTDIQPKQKRLRDAGLLQLSAMLEGIKGLSLRLFTHYNGWTLDELKVLLAKVRGQLKGGQCHSY